VLRRQRFARQRRALRALVRSDRKRVVVGSGGTALAGWVSTEQGVLDLLDPLSWERCLQRQSLGAILAEHVWVHLHYPEQAVTAATTCFSFLRPGGRLRVAVSDGLHPNPEYIQCVKAGRRRSRRGRPQSALHLRDTRQDLS
jgi:predicted SAM-dependent methyltransferase